MKETSLLRVEEPGSDYTIDWVEKHRKGPYLPLVAVVFDALLTEAGQDACALLRVASQVETDVLLHALPMLSIEALLDSDTLRMTAALRVSAVICEPHTCRSSRRVDESGLHDFPCS